MESAWRPCHSPDEPGSRVITPIPMHDVSVNVPGTVPGADSEDAVIRIDRLNTPARRVVSAWDTDGVRGARAPVWLMLPRAAR